MRDASITTVIPTFRRPGLLKHAVQSALNQTYRSIRVDVWDNASGDETEGVTRELSRLDARVSYHCQPANVGPYANFNCGVRAVRSQYFSVLSDDDVLLPEFYARAMRAFETHPDAMFVAMPVLEVDDEGTIIGGPGVYGSYEYRYFAAGEAYGKVPGIWTGYVFRQQIVDEIGFAKESAGPAADVGFVRHVSARYPGVLLPRIAALLRFHPASFSASMPIGSKASRSFWVSMAESLENDPQVPASIRATVRASLERMYVAGLERSVFSSLIDGQRDVAVRTTAILNELGYRRAACALRLLIASHDVMPGVPFALRAVGQRRRARYQQHLDSINRRYAPERERFLSLLHGRNHQVAPAVTAR